jgi:hypothetical protein
MRSEEEIRAEIDRCERERDHYIKKDDAIMANICNAEYWKLVWVLKEG